MFFHTALLCIGIALFPLADTKPSKELPPEGDWHFMAIQNGVKFFWMEDPSWHHVLIKTVNPTGSVINYEYKYEIFVGSSPMENGSHYWTRLRANDEKVLKISKELYGVSRVKLANIKIERWR